MLDYGEVRFAGPVELAHILATAPQAYRCMGSKWLEYMLGRSLTDDDLSSVGAITARFEDSNLDLRTVIAAAASSASFLAPERGNALHAGRGPDLQFGSETFVIARNLRTGRQMPLPGPVHVGRVDRALSARLPRRFHGFR